jgi:hypothetical protein
MLRILYGACSTALDAFRAADKPVDEQLMADLEVMVEHTKGRDRTARRAPRRVVLLAPLAQRLRLCRRQ